MDILTYICIFGAILCFVIFCVVPQLLSWVFAFKYQIKLTVGMVTIPYLKLKDVHISNKSLSIDIDEIGISSSLFNSEIKKKLAFILKDVRINKVVPISPTPSNLSERRRSFTIAKFKLPTTIVRLLQFTVVHMTNISVVWAEASGWLFHTTSAEIKVEGDSVQSSREMVLSATTSETTTRIRRRHLDIDHAEFSYSISANITLAKFPSEKIHISLQRPRCIVNADLFKYFKQNQSTRDEDTIKKDFRHLLPKNFILTVEDTELISNFSDGKVIAASFACCKVNARKIEDETLSFYFAFKMEQFNISSAETNLFLLKNISMDAKLQQYIANIYIVLNTITVVLSKDVWPVMDITQESSSRKKLQNPFNKWNVECCVELWAASATFENNSLISCGHSKIVVERITSHWTAELLLESLGWTLTGLSTLDRRNHVLGTPLYLAVALIKLSHSKKNARIDAMLDTLRIEWNTSLARMLNFEKRETDDGIYNKKRLSIPKCFAANLALSNVNMFFNLQKTANMAMRLDSILLEGSESKLTVQISGLKIIDLDLNIKQFTCGRAEDIANYIMSLTSGHIELWFQDNHLRELNMNILDGFDCKWNYGLHMKLVTILRSFPIKSNPERQSGIGVKWQVYFGRLIFMACVGKHTLQLDATQALIGASTFKLDVAMLKLMVDDVLMIIGTAITLDSSDSNIELLEEREAAEGLESLVNRAWIFNMNALEARFPYKHEFADAIQNEFITAIKWLKVVHKKTKVPFTLDSPLPKDLLIKINECLFEMSDDPFEVRLRDNYELLVDEYNESLKRQQKLDTKITELCQTHLLLPAGKVDELYASLNKKNAEIYVQRSKQITNTNPHRTRLLAWHSHGLTIVALADKSFHGTERALETMKGMDPATPYPPEGLTFSTLWARVVSVNLKQSTVSLRDFPQPFLECRGLHLWGCLVGAEAAPTSRSIRNVVIQLPEPWGSMVVERGMTQLKYYHDFNLEMEHYSYAFGPCWEPVIAQCNISMERILSPSRDPSPSLPFWDKCRLLLHGRLTMLVHHMTVLLHASLDPYNTTEEMELAWNDMALDWMDGKITVKGDLDVYVRTASKYDDCRLLHLPNVKLTVKLDWVCLADPNDHHSVMPCAPDKLPEYSSNQVHDSYRAFRSQNVDVGISLEAKGLPLYGSALLLYGSTLRWFESLKFILSGVTRPTRRGKIFGAVKPRRKQLSRHYRRVRILISLHRFQITYWMSCAMQHGCEMIGNRVVCSAAHNLVLTPFNDGLKRRPRAIWSIIYMNCELTNAEVWLKSALQSSDDEEELPVEKYYCLSVEKVSYGRETPYADSKDTPIHRLVVHDLKGAWTKSNRDVAFALFDAYVKSQQLRRNLSADALKVGTQQRNEKIDETQNEDLESISTAEGAVGHQQSPASMLEQLIAEANHKAVVFSDDQSPSGRQTRLQGLQACQQDDVLHKNWLIALVNAQVVLRGCETKGYVILSAAKAEILQRIHDPESKRTWVGSLECLQYYATVGVGDEDIMWLPVEYIQERGGAGAGPAAVVGSGRAAGGVVSQVVGASGRQLQRIVSRCRCEFFYVSYGSLDPSGPSSDAFTLMHHDLDVCTNSLQYAMLLDVVNSLLLWVEPTRKEAAARLARRRFELQLRSDQSVRLSVQKLQTQVRTLLGALRQLERDAYLAGTSATAPLLNAQLTEQKTELTARTEELDMLLAIHRGSAPHATVRAHEICFKHAQWRLTEADGQLGIADLVLSNFLYTKNSKSDDSVEHLLELGYIHMTNLLPNQAYTVVLSPTEIQRDMPVDHKHVLRIFCRERPPVGGISVKEHFEINVVPITIGLTKKFYNTLLKFCFPERDDPDAMQSKVSKDTSFYVRINQKDDVEKMKERAEKNKLFIYIKIPEVPVRVSYKGNKEKNLEDVRDFSLVIPTLEYHNVTWTWLDLLLGMKADTRRVILHQAIKQKLQIHRNRGNSVDNNTPLEEDKARMLLGKLSLSK